MFYKFPRVHCQFLTVGNFRLCVEKLHQNSLPFHYPQFVIFGYSLLNLWSLLNHVDFFFSVFLLYMFFKKQISQATLPVNRTMGS